MSWEVWAMISKTSLYNRGLITANMKRFWWISALYTFILFFLIPFRYIMYVPDVQNEWKRVLLDASLNFFSGQNDFQMFMIAALPTALAVLLYRYLMSSKETAMIHSLPYTRRTLYLNQLTAGLVLLTAPVLLIGFIMTLLKIVTTVGMYYSMHELLLWMGLTLLFNILFFSIAVFVGMFTGNAIAHMVFTCILHLLPVGIYVLFRENLADLLYGFSSNNGYEGFFDILPFFVLFNHPSTQPFLALGDTFGYLIATLFFFIFAGYAYEKRKLEAASDIIALSSFRPIFKYGVTTCGMLLGGLYFRRISGGSLSISLVGYLFSSFLSYWIAEMLIQKSFKVWHTYKGYLVYVAAVSLLLVSIQVDVFGYVQRMPAPDEIEKIYFGHYTNIWTSEDPATDPKYKHMNYEANSFFSDPDNIKNIMQLHRQLIQQPRQKAIGPRPYIVYMLKNGKYQVRQYTINEKHYAPFLKPIYESMEYKKAKYPIIAQNSGDIKWIEVGDNRTSKRPLLLGNRPEMQEFMALFQEEVRSMTFEEMSTPTIDHVYIAITDSKDKNYHYGFRKDFESIVEWLEEKGYYENLVLLPKDIEYAVLRKEATKVQYDKSGAVINTPSTIEIRDPKVLEELLTISETSQYNYGRTPIYADFYIKSPYGSHSYRTPIYSNVPVSDALQEHMEVLN